MSYANEFLHAAFSRVLIASGRRFTPQEYRVLRAELEMCANRTVEILEDQIKQSKTKTKDMVLIAISCSLISSVVTFLLTSTMA